MKFNNKQMDLTKGAMILAIAIVVQQLRNLVPLPPFVSAIIIGPLINSLMLLSSLYVKSLYIIISIATLLPILAYFQGHLTFIGLIPIVVIGNLIYVLWAMKNWDSPIIFLGAAFKAIFMLVGAYGVFLALNMLNPIILKNIFLMMGLLQILAGIIGILIAKYLYKRLPLNK
jgi:hypothetical protein